MPSELLLNTAARYRALVPDLEAAIGHALDCEEHFTNGEVPRGAAHAFAMEGHLRSVITKLEALSILHAEYSQPNPRD